jgi:hypothetical protein
MRDPSPPEQPQPQDPAPVMAADTSITLDIQDGELPASDLFEHIEKGLSNG